MRLSLRLASLATAFTGLASACFGWGYEGHRTVADLARMHLSPTAKEQIVKILGNDDLAAISTWPDDLRGALRNYGPLAADPEAHEFNKKFPKNQNWHFVDLPIGYPGYTDDSPFSSDNDVVHGLKKAIETLEGMDTGISKVQALKFVVHLTGDIHQPLHTTCGYFDFSDPEHVKLVTDLNKIDPKNGDEGGNLLVYGERNNLHSFWDTYCIEKIVGKDEAKLVALLKDRTPKDWETPGDYHGWPEQWATESAKVATDQVYPGLVYGAEVPKTEKHGRQIAITLPDGYVERAEPVVEDQLAKAGLRLADLLNSIKWAP